MEQDNELKNEGFESKPIEPGSIPAVPGPFGDVARLADEFRGLVLASAERLTNLRAEVSAMHATTPDPERSQRVIDALEKEQEQVERFPVLLEAILQSGAAAIAGGIRKGGGLYPGEQLPDADLAGVPLSKIDPFFDSNPNGYAPDLSVPLDDSPLEDGAPVKPVAEAAAE